MMFGLTGVLNQSTGPVIQPDPFFNDVVLLIRGNNIADISKNPKTLTNNGNVSVSNAITPKYGTTSLSCFGNGSGYLTVIHNDLILGTGGFCIEAWVYKSVDTNTNDGFVSFATGNTDPRSWFYTDDWYNSLGGNLNILNLFTNLNNQWFHIAICRSSSNMFLYFNGNQVGTRGNTANYTSNRINIFAYSVSFRSINAYVNVFRLTKNRPRYTANFNPETDTYLAY